MSILCTDEHGWMDGQTGKQTETDGHIDARTERRTDRQTYLTFVKIIRVSFVVKYEKVINKYQYDSFWKKTRTNIEKYLDLFLFF